MLLEPKAERIWYTFFVDVLAMESYSYRPHPELYRSCRTKLLITNSTFSELVLIAQISSAK